jgi:hypothetical protein
MTRMIWRHALAVHSKAHGWVVMVAPFLLLALGPCGGTGGGSGY